MSAKKWLFTQEGRQCGPVSSPDLKRLADKGLLLPTDLVRREGMANWVKAEGVKGLFTAPESNEELAEFSNEPSTEEEIEDMENSSPAENRPSASRPGKELYGLREHIPAMVLNRLRRLPKPLQEEFLEEFDRKRKTWGVAFLAWLLLGWHYAYVNKWFLQAVYWISAMFCLMWIPVWLLWCFIDLFRLSELVKDRNKDLATEILKDLKAIS